MMTQPNGIPPDRSTIPNGVSATEREDTFDVLVRACNLVADGVVSLHLVRPDRKPLPDWDPGAHLELKLPSGIVRQYSLTGVSKAADEYVIAVLHEPNGRGGSREVHAANLVGRTVQVRGPRNLFRLVPSSKFLFIAGGIGVTPLLPMAAQISSQGRPWKFFFGGRSRQTMAFSDELLALPGGTVTLVPQDTQGLLDVPAILADADEYTAVFVCGPEALLEVVQRVYREIFPSGTLHLERFTPTPAASEEGSPTSGQDGLSSYTVELRRTGKTVEVTGGRSVLEAIRELVPGAASSCEQGFCGTCETPVLEGVPEHRDTVLSDEERAESATMMICVGRSQTPRLVLDL